MLELLDLGSHLHAQLGVEVRERFVEEEHRGLAHDGAAERNALPLPAGEILGPSLQEPLEPEDLRRVVDHAIDLGSRSPADLQSELQVLPHVHVRVEGVALEHHGDVPILGRDVVDHAAADLDGARGDLLETGDHPEQGALAAARRPDQHHELALLDLQVDPGDHRRVVAVALRDIVQDDAGHRRPPVKRKRVRCAEVLPGPTHMPRVGA